LPCADVDVLANSDDDVAGDVDVSAVMESVTWLEMLEVDVLPEESSASDVVAVTSSEISAETLVTDWLAGDVFADSVL